MSFGSFALDGEVEMSDEWDFYFTNVNGVLASIFVDLGIRQLVPQASHPWLLWSWVYFEEPREDGLSSSEESPTLREIEDALTRSVSEISHAELVGRITTDGRREFYFYGPDPARFDDAVSRALESFPKYRFEFGRQEDHGWLHYLNVLYPSPRDNQRIKNRHVLEALKNRGDSLKASRSVSHWAYFRSPEDRARFIAQVISNGFEICNESEETELATECPYGVTIQRIDHIDWDSINEVTLELFELANEHGGEYDGWETSVEKDGQ